MVWVIVLEKPNGDTNALWATNGSYTAKQGKGEAMLKAIGSAVREAKADSLDTGGYLKVEYTGLGEAKAEHQPSRSSTPPPTRPPTPASQQVCSSQE